jgi:hypothetical protein
MAAVSAPQAPSALTPPSSSHGGQSSWNFSVPAQTEVRTPAQTLPTVRLDIGHGRYFNFLTEQIYYRNQMTFLRATNHPYRTLRTGTPSAVLIPDQICLSDPVIPTTQTDLKIRDTWHPHESTP